jgi:hypothetical protein
MTAHSHKNITKRVERVQKVLDRLRRRGDFNREQLDTWKKRLDELLAGVDRPVHVANAGLLKAGKSTLFNAICGEQELFATATVRCTTEAQTKRLDDITLVDTPGIDANEHDSAEADRILRTSDMVLVVHSVTNGEYDRQELDFLEELGRHFPAGEGRRLALVPVFTKGEGRDESELESACARALQQWRQVLGVEPLRSFQVYSKRHLTGLVKQKPRLCELSHVPSLVEYLRDSASQLLRARLGLVENRVGEVARDIDHAVSKRIEAKRRKRQSVAQDVERQHELLSGSYNTLAESVRRSYAQL